MESMSPSKQSAEMRYVTPECSSRYSLISASAEDSGYSSVPSSGISCRAHRETSLSPKDVRKRLFDSGVSSSTPDISRKDRSSRRLSGRCLIPTIILEEEVASQSNVQTVENQDFVHGFSTSTKYFARKLTTTPSPKKHHPYVRDDVRGKSCTQNAPVYNQKTRTPPRKGRVPSSITKFPSFSERSEYRDPCRPRYGAQHVDFLWCLGKERMMAPALSLVLSRLSGEDLMACCIVSKTWRTIVMSDKTTNSRRLATVEKRKLRKENMAVVPPRDRVNIHKENRSILGVIQKERLFPPEAQHIKTPPPKMSPKRLRFELYMKEGQRVDGNEYQHLKPCPHCSFPSLVDTKLNLGACTRHGCQFRFCTLCHCLEHTAPINSQSASPPRYMACPFAPKATSPPSPPQPTLLATRRQLNLVASKRSKRNLRRL